MKQKAITIIDYELGNLFSVKRACDMEGCQVSIARRAIDIENANAIILPGVGAFGQAMENLNRLDLISPLVDHVAAGKPLFGICLGLQLMFDESEEFGSPKGLGFLRGSVKRIPVKESPVPQIGWNKIYVPRELPNLWLNTPLEETGSGSWMYFVHSFYVNNFDNNDALCITNYCDFIYTSAVFKNNIFGTQFHPEKSAANGLNIFRKWFSNNN
jgi:glutamine amidotransferase